MIDIKQTITSMTTRQKVIAGVVAVVIIILLYEVIGMFGGSKTPEITPTPPNPGMMSAQNKPGMPMNANKPGAGNPGGMQPQAVQLLKQTPEATEQEAALMKLQEETQAKYLAAINELQMLRLSLQLAEANQAIMKSKYDTIVTEKNIVDLLTKPAPQVVPGQYAQGLVNQTGVGNAPQPSQQQVASQPAEAEYTVISVSELHRKWAAVLGYQGALFSVSHGDVLPPDGSVVISIDKAGIILERNGIRRKISMVPII